MCPPEPRTAARAAEVVAGALRRRRRDLLHQVAVRMAAIGVAFLLAGPLAAFLRPGLVGGRGADLPPLAARLWLLGAAVPLFLLLLSRRGALGEAPEAPRARSLRIPLTASAQALSILALLLFLAKVQGVSRLFLILFMGSAAMLLTGVMAGERIWRRVRAGGNGVGRSLLLCGTPGEVRQIARRIAEERGGVPRIAGCLLVDGAGGGEDPGECPVLGRIEEAGEVLFRRPIQTVVLSHSAAPLAGARELLERAEEMGVRVLIVPDYLLARSGHLPRICRPRLEDFCGIPMLALSPTPDRRGPLAIKRGMDIVGALLGLALFAPLILLIAGAVRFTSPGPILYRWRVMGRSGREFLSYKFRTMVADADARKASLLPFNEMSGPVFKMGDDPRITPLGRILRKYSLDELPQLWSVLRGDMSLVGPRPPLREEGQRFAFWHKRKLSVKPGITGLWQVTCRNAESSFDRWVELDLQYIDRWSLALDCEILLRTIATVVRGTGK